MALVVLLEDDVDLQCVLHEMLSRAGHDVVSSNTAADAADVLTRHRPDVLVLDMSAGEANDVSIATVAAQYAPKTRLVVMSGLAELSCKFVQHRNSMAQWFLQKPFAMAKFQTIVASAVDFRP